MKKILAWVERELGAPVEEGAGRNNQMIRLAPRMLENGWDEDAIFDAFKAAYDLEDDSSKDGEIRRVITSARKYANRATATRPNAEWRAEANHLAILRRDAARELPNILARYSWEPNELGCGMTAREQRTHFIRAMFNEDEIIWSGDTFHSGKPHHARHFRPAFEWADESAETWPFISQCTFQNGVFSRSNENILSRRYLVVESDALAPNEALAIFCWLHHEQGFPLRAVVFSGKRSLHGWFDRPAQGDRELAAIMEGLRCDPATCKPVQPVRLPGVMRRETGKLQELLYLDARPMR